MSLASPLLTDLYQLTMLQGYFDHGMHGEAVFEFFIRRQPKQRNFFMAAGLEQTLDYLASLRFGPDDIATLDATGLFSHGFLRWLESFRFTGHVDAMPEGSVFFANEPILRVAAPLPQAQFVESRLMNLLHFQTLIASKAARFVLAARGRDLVDFGMRRAHGSEAALLAARASYLAGFAGTATVLAKPAFGIPIYGTMAHSFVQAHDSEIEAFEHFVESHRGPIVLLLDTYDTERGAARAVEVARHIRDRVISSVRLDSGDLGALAVRVREILDAAGFPEIRILASGGIAELKLASLVASGAPIDSYGIGTSLDVSEDCPALDCVYKLEEYDGRPRRKRSAGKATWPGRKQVFRRYDDAGRIAGDVLTLASEPQSGTPLLREVMRDGMRIDSAPSLTEARDHARAELARLSSPLCALDTSSTYEVEIAPALRRLAESVDEQFQ